MIKKTIILLIILVLPAICFADHWVYLRLTNTNASGGEKSKKGHIITIVTDAHTPSETELVNYRVIKVSGLTWANRQQLILPGVGEFRLYEVDKVQDYENYDEFTKAEIEGDIENTDTGDPITWIE